MTEVRAKNQRKKKRVSSLPVAASLDVQVLQPKGHGYRQPCPDEIRAVFTHAGWTQAEAARQLGVNVSTIRRWHTQMGSNDHIPIPYATWRLALILSGLVTPPRQESSIDED